MGPRGRSLAFGLMAPLGAGCALFDLSTVECMAATQCDLASGGVCVASPSNRRWCLYNDLTCVPSGQRWSVNAGDGLAGTCSDRTVFSLSVATTGAGMGTVTCPAASRAGPRAWPTSMATRR